MISVGRLWENFTNWFGGWFAPAMPESYTDMTYGFRESKDILLAKGKSFGTNQAFSYCRGISPDY